MKKRIVILIIASMVLSIIFTGCSNANEKAESMPASSNNESADLDEPAADVDEAVGAGDRVVTGDYQELGKYKVDEITNESTDSGVYGLKYTSKEKIENVVKYFNDLLIGTPNYILKELPTIGAYIKGTINDKGISVKVEYGEGGNGSLVEFYSYD